MKTNTSVTDTVTLVSLLPPLYFTHFYTHAYGSSEAYAKCLHSTFIHGGVGNGEVQMKAQSVYGNKSALVEESIHHRHTTVASKQNEKLELQS